MGAEDDGLLSTVLLQQVEGLPAADRIQPGRRLVPDEQFGVVHQRGGDREARLHAGGVAADRTPRIVGESDGVQEHPHARVVLAPGESEALSDEAQVAEGGQVLRKDRLV